MPVTVDRSTPVRASELVPSAFLVQHSLEYGNADAAGVQRGIDFLNSVCDQGFVAHHMTGHTFRVQEVEPTQGVFQWNTVGSDRGLFDPQTGNQAAFPAMARIDKAKRVLVVYGSPKYQSSKPTATDYDYHPVHSAHYTNHGKTVVRVLDEAQARGTPIHVVSVRQELKGQPNRSFGYGGGGQNEVDTHNAVYDAVKAKYPGVEVWGPHLALGGTRNVADRQRPLQWAWDRDFLTGWMQRARGWDQVMLDWAVVDMNATDTAEGIKNIDQIARWQRNWRQLCDDFYALYDQTVAGASGKARRLGFIEFYSSYVNQAKWADISEQQHAAFELATLMQCALGGAGPMFHWQPEGGFDTAAGFQHYFGWFRKTAVTGGPKPETGTAYPAGQAVKAFRTLIPAGTDIYDVATGNQTVYGIATKDTTLLVNCGLATFTDTVEGQSVTLNPGQWAQIPVAQAPPPDPPTPPIVDEDVVVWNRTDCEAVRSDLNVLSQNRNSAVKARATHALSLMPPPP